MDFDKPKVYGDTSITDGLVTITVIITVTITITIIITIQCTHALLVVNQVLMKNRSSAYFSFDIVDGAVVITANVNTDVLNNYGELCLVLS